MEQLTLHVTGMTCGGCENAVRRAVGRLAGVAHVTASHTENQVTVEYEASQTNRHQIAEAIREAGYAPTA